MAQGNGGRAVIIVTVDIPVMEVSYDFQIDEDVPIGVVRNELADIICRSNQCEMDGQASNLMIWDKRRNVMLDMQRTGYENGLETGSELVMA